MKTTKIIAAIAIVFAASVACAVDNYLYWMVDDANYNGTSIDFSYATVSTDGGASFLSMYDTSGSAISPYVLSDGANNSSGTGGYYAGFDVAPSTFLVELWSDSDERVGWQDYSYETLAQHIFKNTLGGAAVAPFHVTGVVPEPTSGLLMLIGMAGLALRRKRA